jgi:hypothetical protein
MNSEKQNHEIKQSFAGRLKKASRLWFGLTRQERTALMLIIAILIIGVITRRYI